MSYTMRVAAWDPGKITGLATGEFSREEALHDIQANTLTYSDMMVFGIVQVVPKYTNVVEEFILRDNDFRANLLGVRLEGAIEYAAERSDRTIVYRPPSKKSQVPDQVLKDHGLWQTGNDVDWEDGRDANDAIIHLLGYVAFDLKHRPTLERYFK